MDRWTVDDVIEWLKTNGLGRYANTFRDEDVDGAALFGLQEKEILKLLSTVNEDGTRKSPTLRIQRKFRTILEEYRTAARQKRRKMRRSDSLFPPSEDFDSYKKVYVLEPTNGSLKFFENDIISSYLIKYFSSTYRVKCLIPKQDPYETNSPLHITLTGNKANVKTVQNELQTILKTIQTKIFNDEIADKKIIRWSKHIYSDSALTILQKLFLNKKKLTIWEKTSVLSGYYIVHYLVGQHSFCSNEDFIRQTVQNELSYSKDLLISDMNKMQINFRKEFDEYLKTKKQQQQKYQTMAIIYCQYPSQTEMNISLFGLKDQIIIAKKQLKNLLHKHRIKTIRIGLTSNQREYILDSCIHQLKTIEFNHKDDHVKLKIREDLIDAPQYLIIKMKQSVLSMIYQRTTIRFQHIEKAIVLTEDHCVQLKTLAQNYNCEIEKIEIDTQNELISLPKGKIVSTSKYILQQSNQFYSSISISKIISIGKNTIELHQSYDLPIDLTVLSTTTDAIRENIDPNQGNGYYGSDTGQKFLYIQWFLPDNQLNASIEKFLSACLSQIEKFSKTTNQTIAFSTTQWKRNVSVNEFIEELKYQFESEQFANYSWKILFIIEKEQKDLYNEFSQSISTFQSNSDEFEQFFYPISTTSIHLKTSGNEKFSRCENAINNYIKTHHLSTVVLNHAFDSIVWNQYMINTFYKYCLDHHVLPKLARTQCLILIGSIFEVSQVKEKYHLMNELEKRRHTKNSNILLNCCSNDQTFVEQLAQRLIDDDYSVGIDYVDKQLSKKKKSKINFIIICFSYNYSENYDCMKSILSLKESATKIIPIFFVKTSFEGQNECLQQLEAEEWFYESFEQNIQFRLTEILNFDYDKLIIELLQYDTKSAIVNGLDSTSDNLENEDDQPKEIPRHFTTEEIAEKERIYEQKIANIFENNRISEDDLKDLIESLEEVLGDSQKTNFEQDKSDFDEFLSSLQRWIDKATNNPVIKGHLPPFTLTGDYNDAIFPILSNDKAPWWDANAHLDEFNHSKPNKYFVFPQPILSCWCNYDETHQYFQQYINREIQFREKKEHERPEDPKNKEHTRSEDPKNEDHHYPHFHTDMKKGIPAWDVTQNPKVIERYEYIEKHYSNPEKLTKYLNRPKDGYNRYLDQLAVLLKGMNEGTIGKNEEQRLTLGNEKKTREELRKLNELDDPNHKYLLFFQMNSLLLRQQSITHQLRKIYPNVDITKFFDEILVFLNKNPSDSIQIFTSICSDFASFAVLQSFNQSQIMNHSLFIRISHLFRMLLTKATYTCLTKDEEQCLDAISLFATSLCSYKNKIITCFYVNNQDERNFISYERIFFTELFIKKYVRLLTNDICKNSEDKYESYHVKYKVIDRLLASFIQLNDINHSIILDAVLECIKSNIYSELHTKMDFNQSIFTPKQSFFMYHCPKYVCLRHHTHDNESVRKICKSILEFSSDIFQKYLSNEDEEEEKDDEQPRERFEGEDETTKARVTATYVELLNHFALIPKIRVCFIENQIIIDQLIRILELKILRENAKENGRLFNGEVALVSYPIIVLYNLTFEKKISFKLKEKQSVTHVCEKLVKIPNKVIQFASRALAAILKKEDTDEIDSPEEVGRSYLYMIENTLDDLTLTFHGIKLDGVLTNLEDIVQNDQVKEEITNDDEGISLIGQCAYRPDLDVETIQKPALRIIDALSFANEYATEQIKENDLLMEHIRKLADKKEKEKDKEKDERQSIAIRIQWKVEEEAQFISKEVKKINKRQKPVKLEWNETKAVYQYIRGDYRFNLTNSIPTENFDIMISFCRDNQSICDEINQFLTNETSYKISYGEFSPKQMAEKIEHSDIVILCFSSHYQRSYSCRLEGEFANKRSKRIIPINVERGYEPSGWLSTVIKNKDRIELKDFKEKLVQRIAKEYEH